MITVHGAITSFNIAQWTDVKSIFTVSVKSNKVKIKSPVFSFDFTLAPNNQLVGWIINSPSVFRWFFFMFYEIFKRANARGAYWDIGESFWKWNCRINFAIRLHLPNYSNLSFAYLPFTYYANLRHCATVSLILASHVASCFSHLICVGCWASYHSRATVEAFRWENFFIRYLQC